ncbi:MAG: hypothetical protein N3B16_07705 [Candidatus Aminicenantes bacterium]|nr:hypothetical protein [Candidatus Aminicenantes bacterium]
MVKPLFPQPMLSQPEILADKILVYPDVKQLNVIHYVPTSLTLVQNFGQPQFFFYKYIYIKQKTAGAPQTIAGGILTLGIEFSDDSEILRRIKGEKFSFRPVPIEKIDCQLSYEVLSSQKEKEEEKAEKEIIAKRKLVWTRKNFTLPLDRVSAQLLWKIFEENKSTGLSVECEFEYKGYELEPEGKIIEGVRSGRISFLIPITMKSHPDLFRVINLAEKINFTYRNLTLLCFDFVNRVSNDLAKIMVEVEILTARRQRDFKTIYFTPESEPQVDLEFNIPEAKGGKYKYKVTRFFKDGKVIKSDWLEGDEVFLDISTYEIKEIERK